jgi:hypothetical protein
MFALELILNNSSKFVKVLFGFVGDNSTKMNNKRLRKKIENRNYELRLKRMN